MSMNLHCAEVELWQTPTYITYMCLNEGHDDPDSDWKAIRDRYICWVRSRLNGVWHDKEDLKNTENLINDHVEYLLSYDKLDFYIL